MEINEVKETSNISQIVFHSLFRTFPSNGSPFHSELEPESLQFPTKISSTTLPSVIQFQPFWPSPTQVYSCLRIFALAVVSAYNALPQDPLLPPGFCSDIISSLKATIVEIPSPIYKFLLYWLPLNFVHMFIVIWHSMYYSYLFACLLIGYFPHTCTPDHKRLEARDFCSFVHYYFLCVITITVPCI